MADTFSVAMCTFNGARYLPQQLESIAAQTRPPGELVVCDDRSTDDTPRVLEEFARRAPFPVRVEVNEGNLGSTRNFAKAVGLCRRELIALSDQDDVWAPEKLERVGRVFDARAGVGLVFTDAELVDEELRPLGHRLWERVAFDEAARRLVRTGRALDVLLPGWTATGATMAFRAAFVPLVLDIPDDLPMIHDGWIALVVAAVAEVAYLDEPLIRYRQHPRQQVGAPEKAGGPAPPAGLSDIRGALGRRNSYAELIRIAERVRGRLLERRGQFADAGALGRLDARLRHLRSRESLPEGRLARLPGILGELLSRRYSLYSNGLYSAVKDFLA
jgi:glycosyltransferase involved in cell wall biosynthesis